MKYTVGLIMAVAAPTGLSAQSLADLPECGVCAHLSDSSDPSSLTERILKQTCVQNMLGQASSLGCEADDVGCLCQNVNFTYGIRDCSIEACKDQAEAIINYGAEYCRSKYQLLSVLLPSVN